MATWVHPLTILAVAARPRVLIAGGGVAALEALLALRVHVGHTVARELLAPEDEFVYRPSSVAEPFGRGQARRFALGAIVEDQGAELRRGALGAVDAERAVAITKAGDELSYDMLVVAVGATPEPGLPGALTFGGPEDTGAMTRVLEEVETGEVSDVVFTLPSGSLWPLPLYELALMTAVHASAHRSGVQVVVVTPEERPLELFGPEASDAVGELLRARGVKVHALSRPVSVEQGVLHIAGAVQLAADRVVTLPRLAGPRVPGLPWDAEGFIPVDRHGLVRGESDVYAAGDATVFPLKQGGLAAQQADAVAEAIAARAGAAIEPRPFRAVVRGLLLTGGEPLYLRAEPGASRRSPQAPPPPAAFTASRPRVRREESAASTSALWWPPGKIAGRYLAPYLATARPSPLGASPLADRPPARRHPPNGDPGAREALELALILAEHDARWEDYDQALQALDAAEALAGALPPEYEAKRRRWRQHLKD